MTTLCRQWFGIALLFLAAAPRSAAADETLRGQTVLVAVAANFAEPQAALAQVFGESTGATVKSSSGSTGKLYAQIQNGAPFDVFLSADAEHAAKLEAESLAVSNTRFTYATGRLALFAPKRAAPLKDAAFLKEPAVMHIALANPETAPYGAAAVSTLKKLNLWESVKDRVVYGENITQTYQFVASGGAEAGFVAYSQVMKDESARYWLIPETYHAPLVQDAILLAPGKENPVARRYLAFLQREEARKIIEGFGYTVSRASH